MTSNALPSRVLDIFNFDAHGDVRLYETSFEPANYICLSHCWGQSRPRRMTTRQSLDENKKGIPWDDLEQTFQDAIFLARRLDVHYLWIDSFCIIQDDVEDWKEQSNLMAGIYGGAILTIAASKSRDSSGGCFSQLDPSYQEVRCSIEEYSHLYTFYVRKKFDQGFFDSEPWHGALDRQQLPLFDRAWAFQERVLSTRVLYFAPDEIVWECLDQSRCSCGCVDSSDDFWGSSKGAMAVLRQPSTIEFPVPKYNYGFLSGINSNHAKEWRWLVVQYSGLSLSYEKDKLHALSGLARRFEQLHPGNDCNYMAGLWSSTLLEDLLWSVHHSTAKQGRPQFWRAPTWSWASVNSKVSYALISRNSKVIPTSTTFLKAEWNAKMINSRTLGEGESKSGYITLRGPVIMGNIDYRWAWGTDPFRIVPRGGMLVQAGGMLMPVLFDYNLRKAGPGRVRDGSTVLCLLMAIDERSGPVILVLRRKNVGSEVYERIGLVVKAFDAHWSAWDPISRKAFDDVAEEREITIV
jgi:hypothetical protein